MAYRNGTYVAFHAKGTTDPTASDIKYYNMLCSWNANDAIDFKFVNSHDKTCAVKDTSLRQTLAARIMERMSNSKNMVLIITEDTHLDNDWVPFEIQKAVDKYKIPIIATYPDKGIIRNPSALFALWPWALKQRIDDETAGVIHIPFKIGPLLDAIDQFNYNHFPKARGLSYYSDQAYREWGLL